MAIYERWTKGDVYLEPIEHVYIHKKTNEKFTSVTKVISSLVEPFETELIAERIANKKDSDPTKNQKYLGMSKEQIIDHWVYLNDSANEYGTNVHEILEAYLLAQKWYKPKDDFERKVIKAYDSLNLDEGRTMYPERVMFSSEHKLAGTSDIIIDVDDIFFDVADFKGLPIDTPILTRDGWKTIKDVKKNDWVYDKYGKLVLVKGVSEIRKRPCIKIYFDNGETIISDINHRWLVEVDVNNKFTELVKTTSDLMKLNAYNTIRIKACEPLNLETSIETRVEELKNKSTLINKNNQSYYQIIYSVESERLLGGLGVIFSKIDGYIRFKTNLFNDGTPINNDVSYKTIIRVCEVESIETKCLEVAGESSTFLYGNHFGVTHNTNKVFNFYSEFNKYFKKPFDHFPYCEYTVYTIQLSIYAYMYQLEFPYKKWRQSYFLYWDKEKEDFQKINCMYLKDVAKKILDIHKMNLLF